MRQIGRKDINYTLLIKADKAKNMSFPIEEHSIRFFALVFIYVLLLFALIPPRLEECQHELLGTAILTQQSTTTYYCAAMDNATCTASFQR